MLYRFLENLHQYVNFVTAEAHCDIPYKIYNPITAQLAALSVLRFLDLINELQQKTSLSFSEQAQLIRLIGEKKPIPPKSKKKFVLSRKVFLNIPSLMSTRYSLIDPQYYACRIGPQTAPRKRGGGADTNLVNIFSDNFWLDKDADTFRVTCLYPPTKLSGFTHKLIKFKYKLQRV